MQLKIIHDFPLFVTEATQDCFGNRSLEQRLVYFVRITATHKANPDRP